jgi:hypothetical protein
MVRHLWRAAISGEPVAVGLSGGPRNVVDRLTDD